jgi:16S rRNA (cytosine967-C5)-methyltransferase
MLLTQQLASHIISGVLTQGRNLTELLNETWQTHPLLTYPQRAATQDLSYGTLRFYGLINQVLQALLHKPITDQVVRHLLLVSLYQLIFTQAKTHAIVHSAVSLAKVMNKNYAKSFINAILRHFLRQKETLLEQAQHTLVGQYSHPQWWIKRMQVAYPTDWEALLLANNQHPPLTLRLNRRQTDADRYLTLLENASIPAHKLAPYTIQLQNPVPVHKLPYFFEGHVSVQDWGAQFAAELLDVQAGMRVLDACAAPGGKTCHILEIADVSLLALDKDSTRLERVQENLTRLHLTASLCCADASVPSSWWDGQAFDRILADVPCSASGVVKRHPDIKWLRQPEDFGKYATQQSVILDRLWDCLRKGGKLLYTTCSIFPEENIEQAQAFIQRHTDAILVNISLNRNGQLLPTQEHDGFYYALFQKG